MQVLKLPQHKPALHRQKDSCPLPRKAVLWRPLHLHNSGQPVILPHKHYQKPQTTQTVLYCQGHPHFIHTSIAINYKYLQANQNQKRMIAILCTTCPVLKKQTNSNSPSRVIPIQKLVNLHSNSNQTRMAW